MNSTIRRTALAAATAAVLANAGQAQAVTFYGHHREADTSGTSTTSPPPNQSIAPPPNLPVHHRHHRAAHRHYPVVNGPPQWSTNTAPITPAPAVTGSSGGDGQPLADVGVGAAVLALLGGTVLVTRRRVVRSRA